MLNRVERRGKMKKKIISGIIISVIVLTIAYCLLWIFGSEAGINVFLSHNRGAINLFVNGENINIDGTEIEWYTYTDEIKNGNFEFPDGMYGENLFEYKIPGYEYVTVKFGIFNTNWWHVNKYDVKISVTEKNDIIYVEAEEKVNTQGSHYADKNSVSVTKGEKKDLWIYLGP